jgi:hypothetical protein
VASALTELRLRGAPACGRGARSGELARAARRRRGSRGSRLWGDGHGKFRTRGRHGAATVRGTRWLTEERCAGTLVRVSRGVVGVRDFARHRTVEVPAGHRYLARASKRR